MLARFSDAAKSCSSDFYHDLLRQVIISWAQFKTPALENLAPSLWQQFRQTDGKVNCVTGHLKFTWEKQPVYEYYISSEPRSKEGEWQDDCLGGYDTSFGPAHSLGPWWNKSPFLEDLSRRSKGHQSGSVICRPEMTLGLNRNCPLLLPALQRLRIIQLGSPFRGFGENLSPHSLSQGCVSLLGCANMSGDYRVSHKYVLLAQQRTTRSEQCWGWHSTENPSCPLSFTGGTPPTMKTSHFFLLLPLLIFPSFAPTHHQHS